MTHRELEADRDHWKAQCEEARRQSNKDLKRRRTAEKWLRQAGAKIEQLQAELAEKVKTDG